MSVTRLAEQGFSTQLNETPRITHSKGFNSTLKQREGLYFLPVTLVALPANMRLEVNQTAEGTTARVTPVTLTPAGMEILRNRNDLWTFNCRNFLVRVHRTQRKALFMPDNNCPVPTERLENNRRTVIQRPNDNTEVLEETYQDLDKKQQKEGQLDRRNMVQSETGEHPFQATHRTTSTTISKRANTDNCSTSHKRQTTSGHQHQCTGIQKRSLSLEWDQQDKQWSRHSLKQQQFHIQRKWVQHRTTGTRKVHIGNAYTSSQEGTCTSRNKQMLHQMWQCWQHGDNKEEGNTRHRVDRLNKLWREHSIQR